MSSSGRIEDELEVKSFLLEVEDADLTEAGLAQKLKAPKLTETFVKKLQMLADKYDLRGGASKSAAPAAGAKSSVAKGAAAKGAGAKGVQAQSEERAAARKCPLQRLRMRSEPQVCRTLLHRPAQRIQNHRSAAGSRERCERLVCVSGD
jgi:hypothetical protein